MHQVLLPIYRFYSISLRRTLLYTNTFLDWQASSDKSFAMPPDYGENSFEAHCFVPHPLVYIYKSSQRKPSCYH